MDNEQVSKDTIELLRALSVALEADKGTLADSDERVLDAEGLAVKCFFHAISCFYLYRTTNIPELGARFFDSSSMSVLARAAMESCLVFDYVFYSPKSEAERELRHLSWVLADLIERQELPTTLPDSKQKQARELRLIKSLKERIRKNTIFLGLSSSVQKALLEKKQWRWSSWTDIARDAGFSKLLAEHVYRLFCSYAHSGSISVLQVRQAKARDDQKFLAETTLRLINVALASMTSVYCAFFPKARAAVELEKLLKEKVDEWMSLGRGE